MEKDRIIRSGSRFKQFLTAFTFVVLIVLIYSLRRQIGGAFDNLGKVNAWALLLMIPIEFFNYDAYARLYRSLFRMLGTEVEYWPMYRVMLELNFVNHILPTGGVSGVSYFGVRLRSENISTTKSTFVQVMKFMFLYISFLPILVLALFLLALRGHTNNFVILIASSIITAIIIGTLIGIYIIDSRSRINSFLTWITKAINWLLHLVRRKHSETINLENAQRAFGELHDNYKLIKKNWRQLQRPLFYTTIADLTEVAAAYVVYVAFGHFVNLGAVILAYAVANLGGLISVLPAGIGVFEALMTGVLTATGIPVALSIPVTIMYRVVNMFIQLTPGYVLYQRAVREGLSKKI